MLRKSTTTLLKPEEVHDLGLREVTRIETEMRAILDTNGFADRPIGEAMAALGRNPSSLADVVSSEVVSNLESVSYVEAAIVSYL